MIYFVRHGQTDYNFKKLFHIEKLQTELNNTGLQQAQQVALKLKDISFDVCYCSPFKRAMQTAEAILQYHPNLKLIVDERIAERSWGEASGLPVSVCEPDRWDIKTTFAYKGIEKIEDVYARVKNFYDEINDPNKNILVVSHSGVARVSNAYFNGIPTDGIYKSLHLHNAEFTTFQ